MIKKDKNILKRSRVICEGKRGDGPVVYWMERDHRLDDNWALLYAQQEALIRKKALHIIFVITPHTGDDASIQTQFLLHSIDKLVTEAQQYSLPFSIIRGNYEEVIPRYLKLNDCNLLVTDFSPLRHKMQSCQKIKEEISIPFIEVDAHNVIPAWVSSSKKEYAAYTIRPKIHRLLPDYLIDFPKIIEHPFNRSPRGDNDFYSFNHSVEFLNNSKTGCGIFKPGCSEAKAAMQKFLDNGLNLYDERRNNPNLDGQSGLSPYLHFGQLAPQRLAYTVAHTDDAEPGKKVFLEELIVRKELADNFCLYEPRYDEFRGFHPWAQKTLLDHREDERQYCYTLKQLEYSHTHEELWNVCQRDLVTNSKLHGFLRMYWAKKILEWTATPDEALEYAIYLNDKYSIDGTDPNGYAGIAWSIGGVHDRAWSERPVYGKIRYMNERGCRRKFKVEEYIAAHPSDQ